MSLVYIEAKYDTVVFVLLLLLLFCRTLGWMGAFQQAFSRMWLNSYRL